ncbi:Chromatin assembly factor 1 subunit [Tilletia horrida]|nr:Chromatin assembly factor 1 subunit [Tilletia horrida]
MVRSITLEVRWHNVCPIYSCHFQSVGPSHLKRVLDHNSAQAAGLPVGKSLSGEVIAASVASSSKHALPPIMPGGQSWRLATAGGDNNARIWMVHPNMPSPAAMAAAAGTTDPSLLPAPHPPRVEYLATLSRHTGVVNVVRFCPKGELLTTAGDDGNVLFWIPSDKLIDSLSDDPSNYEKEHWRVRTMTRPTSAEIYDLAWSPSGEQLVVGGTDFALRVISANDGSILREISEHCLHIQGVAWDPLNEFLATQSSDRSVHVHQILPRGTQPQAHLHSHPLDSHSSFAGLHSVSRNSHLTYHRRTGSMSATGGSGSAAGHLTGGAGGSASGTGLPASSSFVWDHHTKPPMPRRGSSHASIASESGAEQGSDPRTSHGRGRTGRSSTPFESAIAGQSTHLPPSNQLPGTILLSPSMVNASLPPASTPAILPPVSSSSALKAAAAAAAAAASSSGLPPPPPPTSASSITMGQVGAASSSGRAVTPTPVQSVPPSPFSTASAMNPPQLTPSRRSSFSGSAIDAPSPPMTTISVGSHSQSQSQGGGGGAQANAGTASSVPWTPATSVSGVTGPTSQQPTKGGGVGGLELRRSESRARSARSSSPMPLPAIRAPPSPKQRLQQHSGGVGAIGAVSGVGGPGSSSSSSSATAAAVAAGSLSYSGSGIGQIARTRMYGDENYSGFFRRLNFSPDGALLVTPSGIFEGGTAAGGTMLGAPPPASPTTLGFGFGPDHHSPSSSANSRTHTGKHGASSSSTVLPAVLGGPATGPSAAAAAAAAQQGNGARSTVYMYARGSLHKSNAPIAHFPGHKTATLVVSFSPILYELRPLRRGDGTSGMPADNGAVPHLTVPLEAGKHKVVPLSSMNQAYSGSATPREEDAAPLSVNLRGTPGPSPSPAGAHGMEAGKPTSSNGSSIGGPTTEGGSAPKSASQTMPSPSTSASVSGAAAPPPSASAVAAAAGLPPSMIGLPYRMVFAVATQESVWIYDTQQTGPVCCFSNMHYASFTDLSWSPDGQSLVMSSTDGYCSVVVFDYGELGVPYNYHAQPSLTHPASASHRVSTSASHQHSSSKNTASTTTLTMPSASPQSTPSSAHAVAAPLPKSAVSTPGISASSNSRPWLLSSTSSSSGTEDTGDLGLAIRTGTAEASSASESTTAAARREGGDGDESTEQPKKKRRIAPVPVAIP